MVIGVPLASCFTWSTGIKPSTGMSGWFVCRVRKEEEEEEEATPEGMVERDLVIASHKD